MEINSILSASTHHLRRDTADWLEAQAAKSAPALIVYSKHDYGFFVYVPDDESLQLSLVDKELQTKYELLGLIWLARYRNARWLELDRDAVVEATLPLWDW